MVDGDEVYLRQDMRDTAGWWFYWSFRVRGAEKLAGRTARFNFTDGNPIGVMGPAVSVDGGVSWSWLGMGKVSGSSFGYAFDGRADEVRFCFAIPYPARFEFDEVNNPYVKTYELCRSRKERAIPVWRVGRIDGKCRYRVMITARHHSCESMANFAMEGITGEILSDTEEGRWFRENVEVVAIPFVDFDGVVAGDQGKNRRPHDHNRDYGEVSIYPSVRAIKELGEGLADGRLAAAFDLHCPYKGGEYNEVIYMVGSQDERIWTEQNAFAKILEEVQTGTLVYRASDNLPFGKAWNTITNYRGGVTFSRWAGQLEGVRLSTGIEIPYARANGRTVTAETARQFGRDLAIAIRKYLTSQRAQQP